MKYTVRPLYIREAIIFGDLQNYKTVNWDEIHHGNESDGKETLGILYDFFNTYNPIDLLLSIQ